MIHDGEVVKVQELLKVVTGDFNNVKLIESSKKALKDCKFRLNELNVSESWRKQVERLDCS